MIIFRDYNEQEKLDRVWYQSSNIIYSECEDKTNDFKTLRVVFKNGAQYQYKNVDVKNYVLFVHGGTDGSNGKALNQFIKPNCEYERIVNANLQELEETKNLLMEQRANQNVNPAEKTNSSDNVANTDF